MFRLAISFLFNLLVNKALALEPDKIYQTCIYEFVNSSSVVKRYEQAMQYASVGGENVTQIEKILKESKRCLIIVSYKNQELLESFSTIKRHLVLVENVPCDNVPASSFETEMYCLEKDKVWENIFCYRERLMTQQGQEIKFNIISKGSLQK